METSSGDGLPNNLNKHFKAPFELFSFIKGFPKNKWAKTPPHAHKSTLSPMILHCKSNSGAV